MTRESSGRLSAWLNRVRHFYPSALVVSDLLAFAPAFWFAGLLRNEVTTFDIRWSNIAQVAVIAVVIFLVVAWFSHLYRNRFRVATFEELVMLGGAWCIAGGITAY